LGLELSSALDLQLCFAEAHRVSSNFAVMHASAFNWMQMH
jgi:hypothetical protein